MASVQIQAELIEDVYLHQAVNSDGDVAVAQNAAGLQEMFSIGTDGKLYNTSPSSQSSTGWAQTNLQCPAHVDIVAAHQDTNGHIVVAVANQTTMQVFTLTESGSNPRWDPAAWKTIQPGTDIVGPLTFYEMQMRINNEGVSEFLLVYFQRMFNPQWEYTYRVGRGQVTGDTWHIGFNIDALYQGPNPAHPPAMTVGRSAGKDSVFLYWPRPRSASINPQFVRVWRNIDGTHEAVDLALPDSSDYIRRLFALGTGENSELYAAGLIHPDAVDGLYRFDWSRSVFVCLSGGSDVVDAEGAFSQVTGYDVLAVGRTGDLFHIHGSADGSTWTPFSLMTDRASSVIGSVTDAEGPVFVVATVDKTLWRYYRHPQAQDWQSEEVALETASGEQVVWYTTHVAALDGSQRAIPACPLTVSCPETTEVMLNGRTEIIGPDRPLSVKADSFGNLTIQQSTAELANLFVPQLTITLATGEAGTVIAAQRVNERLYNLTGDQLRNAKGRNGKPVLGPAHQGDADTLARKIATAMSLGHAPKAQMVRWESLGLPESARGRAIVAGLNIDVGDLFETIKDAVLQVTKIDVTAVGVGVVDGLQLAIQTVEGTYNVFVNTLEQAFDVVRTVFQSVAADFETVLEWLGNLFDWQAIKTKADDVTQAVLQGLAAIPTIMQQGGLPGSIDTIFAGLKRQTSEGFDYVRGRAGAKSLGEGAKEVGFTNPDASYQFNGKNVSVSANWLIDRVKPHLAGATLPSIASGPGWSGFDTMLPTLGDALTGQILEIIDNLTNFFQSLPPNGALDASLDRLFDQFETLASGLLDFMKTLMTSAVGAISTLMSSTALTDLLQTRITIPVVSDVLKALGFDPQPKLLDMVALLIAVPLHVIEAALPASATAEVDKKIYLTIAVCFGIILVVSTINDGLPEPLQILALICGVVWLIALSAAAAAFANTEPKEDEVLVGIIAYFFFQAISLYQAFWWWGRPNATRAIAAYAIVDAVLLNVCAAVWAIRKGSTSKPAKEWQMLANHVGTLPDIFRWPDLVAKRRSVPLRVAMAVADVIGMGTLMAGAIADYVIDETGVVLKPRLAADAAPA